jgi:hypothetical protein
MRHASSRHANEARQWLAREIEDAQGGEGLDADKQNTDRDGHAVPVLGEGRARVLHEGHISLLGVASNYGVSYCGLE